MANFFDQFDGPQQSAQPNPFDQFDGIVIDTPKGRLEFSPDTPVETIRKAIGEAAPEGKAREAALNQWADQFVSRERKGGGVGQTISDSVRNLGRGTPVGSWLDEANAATAGLTGTPYDEALAYQRAQDRAVDKETGMVGTATKVAGAVASAPFAPVIRLAQGATLLPQMVNAGLTGAAYGGLYGAGEGESLQDRAKDAASGAGIGVGVGAAAPVIAKGVGNAVGYVADKFRGVPAELKPYQRPAVERVARAAGDDALAQNYAQQRAMLGPEGMLLDMGPNLQGQANAIANQPGSGQKTLVDALSGRKATAPGRIDADVNAALGNRMNMPQTEEAIRGHYSQQAKPLYDQFRQSPVPFTKELEAVQDVLKTEPSVLRHARKLATLDGSADPKQFFAQIGDDGAVTINRVPNASELDYMKRALDDMSRNAGRGTNEERVYSALAKRLRDSVDSALSPNDPSQSVYARARGVAGEGIGIRDALEEGRNAFAKGFTPDQMRAEMQSMSAAERTAYAMGARQRIADVMGDSATGYGSNADMGVRKLLGGDYAREKLGIVAGDPAAKSLIRRVDAESAFEKSRGDIVANSATSKRLQAQKEFPNPTDSKAVGRELGQKTFLGMLAEGGYRAGNALLGGALNERRSGIASDAAKMLSATDRERDALARALLGYNQGQALTQQTKAKVEKLARYLLEGSRVPLIEHATD